jgi:NAD(P)-dependent dehydrogenase (short-subunit alcohol dehydrogenase family)
MAQRGWALITGAGRRIGRALAVTAAEAGFDVVVHAHSSTSDAAETARQIHALGRRCIVALADLRWEPALAGLFSDPVGERGGPVTLLVNSASLFEDDRVETLTAKSLDAHYEVNLRAPVLLAQAFAAALPAERQALIVNVVDQRVWRLTPRFFSYTLAKAGLWAATQTLAQALAPQIRVNAIGPGPTLPSVHQAPDEFAAEAAAVPLGHGPTPQEVGAALRYLIDAPSVTGQMIAVDGGQHLAWRTPDLIGGD